MKKLILTGSMVFLLNITQGLTIPGLISLTGGPLASTTEVNTNVIKSLQLFSAKSLASQIEPFISPKSSRVRVALVEPVLGSNGDIDPAASGAALNAAIKKAASTTAQQWLVEVDAGKYTIPSLTLPANVEVVGASTQGTVITATQVTTTSPLLSSLTLDGQSISVNANETLHNVAVNGPVTLTDGSIVFDHVQQSAGSITAITVNNVSSFTLKGSDIQTKGTAIMVNNTVPGAIASSHITGAIVFKVNAAFTLFNNVLDGVQTFFGTAATTAQHCHGNVDSTMNPLPNPAWATTNACIASSTLTVGEYQRLEEKNHA